MAEQDERCVAEYTEQDRANEGCCWTWQRDQCPGVGCRCVCHMSGEPVRTTYFDLVKEIEGYRQRSRDEDTARIRLNHARIDAEERAAKAEAERDAQRAIMDAQGRVSEQHRTRVQELSARLDALAAENETAWQTLARERDSWQAEANRLTAELDELRRMEDIVLAAAHADIQDAQAERDAHEAALNAIWATAGAPEGLSPLQAVERLVEAEAALVVCADAIRDGVWSVLAGGTPLSSPSFKNLKLALARAESVLAALAGSREQAQGEVDGKWRSTEPCMYCRVVMPGMVSLNDGRRVCRACAIAQSDCRKDRS